ncbi:MAG: hypothetical protein C4321_08110, partial [Chloroflexota bacterium]
ATPMRSLWRFCPACGLPAGATFAAPEAMNAMPATIPALTPERIAEAERLNEEGATAYNADDLAHAIDLFSQAIAANPTNSAYYVNLAVALSES